MRFWMRYTCFSNVRQGSLCQASLVVSNGAFLSAILTCVSPSIQQCPRQHILWLSQRPWLLGQSLHNAHWLAPTHQIDHCVRAFVVVTLFRLVVLCRFRPMLSTGHRHGWEVETRIELHLGIASIWNLAILMSLPFWSSLSTCVGLCIFTMVQLHIRFTHPVR